VDYVSVEVGDYEFDIIALHEMPGLRVVRLLTTSADMHRLKGSLDLLRLALKNPNDWDTKIKSMSMGELMKLVDRWMTKSQALSNEIQQEEEAFEEMKEQIDEEFDILEEERSYSDEIDKLLTDAKKLDAEEDIDPDLEFEDFFKDEDEDGDQDG
jgi:hypothetical protein